MDKIEFFPIDAGSRGSATPGAARTRAGGSKGQQGAARLPMRRGRGRGSEGSGAGGGKSGGDSEGWREREWDGD